MTATTPTRRGRGARPGPTDTRRLVRTTALAGAVAAVATTAVAAVATAADVDLAVDGTAIPLGAFAWWTLVGAALGGVLARSLRERRRFLFATTVALALSLVPALAAPDQDATRATLVATHLLAAVIVLPPLTRSLPGPPDHR